MPNAVGDLRLENQPALRRFRKSVPVAWQRPLKLAAIFALTLGLAYISVYLTRLEGRIAAIWPVNAALFVILLRHNRAEWPALLATFTGGLFLANLLSQDSAPLALMFAITNLVEVGIAAAVFTSGRRPRFISPRGVLRLFCSAIAGCCLSTLIIAVCMAGFGAALGPQDAALWFAADALGYLLVAPTLWILMSKPGRLENKGNAAIGAAQLILLAAATCIVFWQTSFPLLFLVSPGLVWLAFSGGARQAAYGMLVVAAISLPMTLALRGPIALIDAGLVTQILVLQLFLASNTALSLAVGTVISERQRLLSHLRRSRSALRATAGKRREMLGQALLAEKMSGVGHWSLDVVTQVAYWSPEVYAIHGVSDDSFDPHYADAIAFYAEEDRARVHNLISCGLKSGEGWEFEATLVRSCDGARRRVNAIGRCLKDNDGEVRRVFGVFRDITDEKRLFNELAERERLYKLLADYSTDIIVQFGADGRVIYASPSCHLLGIAPEQAVGRSLAEFAVEDDKALSVALTKDLFSGPEPDRSIRREFRVRGAEGNLIWLEGNPQIIRGPDGRPASVISTFRNVTERREREDALALARKEAELAAQAKAEFLSHMSHEIRTPLNGLLGFTQLIRQTKLTGQQRHFADRISGTGEMLRAIVDDILDFSKVDAGRMDLERAPFDLNELVSEVIELVDAGRPDKSVPIISALPAGEVLSLAGDELRVRQILVNLVGNAAKFTRHGRIEVSLRRSSGLIEIQIKDTGAGIAPGQLETIFEGFRQADSSVTRRFGGTGLGLSISRSLARLMGGNISLESKLGEGTQVTLALPDPDSTESAPAEPQRLEDCQVARRARIMAVDDVAFNLEFLEAGLTHAGHSVTTFNSAEAAIDDLRSGTVYDVILMDVQMPDMDGQAAARVIRRLPGATAGTPIVALTAHALPSEVASCLKAGMNAHVSKPVDLIKLNRLIAELVTETNMHASPLIEPPGDRMAQLRAEYGTYLSTVSEELAKILQTTDDARALNAVSALAHAIAGTAGSLGYEEVSQTAFELEAAARNAWNSDRPATALQPCLVRFLQTLSKARA
jgi:PAS domain S-box-containing protein